MRAALTLFAVALLVVLVPRPGDSHAPELHGFRMVAFEPPVEAPGFALPDLLGRSTELGAFRDRYVLLNFWATWCAPCIREMPSLQALEDSLGAAGLAVVAVSVDKAGQDTKVKGFVSDLGMRFKVLLDSEGLAQRIYGARELPSTFLIDPNGKIVAAAKGARDWASAEALTYFSEIIEHR